jgi:predicted transcriptional regulator
MEELQVSRITATRYLDILVKKGFMKKQKIWKTNFYINEPLYKLFKVSKTGIQKAEPVKTVNPDHA